MKYHSDTREWEYDSEGKKIIWKSFFPEYPFEHSEYGIAFFYSPYYVAEDNNIEVCTKDRKTIGWLITLSYLQETDESLIAAQKQWLNKFSQVGICLLTQYIAKNESDLFQNQDECDLSEIDLPSCHIFVFRRTLINDADLDFYMSEFYAKGFYHIRKLKNAFEESLYYKSNYKDNIIKSNPNYKLTLSKCELIDEVVPLLNNLYKGWLPFSYVNSFSRYIYLYQVVEYFMEIAFEESLCKHIDDFNNKSISKNDLRNQIGSDSKEETKIEMVFEGIQTSLQLVMDFKYNVDVFLNRVGIEFHETSIGKYVYKVRNVLVHNMRIAIEYESELSSVVECFEKLIALRLRMGMSDYYHKHMVVCDVSEKYKKNKKRMRRTYVQYKYGK